MAARSAHLRSTADGRGSTMAERPARLRSSADGLRRSYAFSYRAWRFS